MEAWNKNDYLGNEKCKTIENIMNTNKFSKKLQGLFRNLILFNNMKFNMNKNLGIINPITLKIII